MITSLDHVVVATADLEKGVANYSALFGAQPLGRNVSDGAETAVFDAGNTRLELIAPVGAGAVADRLRASLEADGEGLRSLVFAVDDIAKTHRRMERLGLAPDAIGASPVGQRFRTAQDRTHGVRHFFIQRDAAPRSQSGDVTGMDHVVVQTPDPDRAAALYGARLGLDMALDRSNEAWGQRLMFFRCGDMIVEVSSQLKAPVTNGPDKLWGVTWRVKDADAAQKRMDAAGVSVSTVRDGRKPGTRVFSVRDGTCGVPTLMLQPSPARD